MNVKLTVEDIDSNEAKAMLNYANYHSVLFGFDEWLRQELKHGSHESDELYDQMEMIREKFNEMCELYGVSPMDLQ